MTEDKLMELALSVALETVMLEGGSSTSPAGAPLPPPSTRARPALKPALTPIEANRSNVVLVLVSSQLAPRLAPAVAALGEALRNEGWDPELQDGSPDPGALRQYLHASHFSGSLKGAFLIGTLPCRRRQRELCGGLGSVSLLFVDSDGGRRSTGH
jgi:hypothetical protein